LNFWTCKTGKRKSTVYFSAKVSKIQKIKKGNVSRWQTFHQSPQAAVHHPLLTTKTPNWQLMTFFHTEK